MKFYLNILLVFIFVMFADISFAQEIGERSFMGRKMAEYHLKEVIENNELHNIITPDNTIIKSEESLLKIIEPVLFDIYGKENIERQKPYEINDFENYYVVSGTMETGRSGGTFLLIIDKRNCQILKITHGK
ncbi:MAG: NTF2 fold immunity protein [Weeksellaceae bacterium]